MSIKKAGLTAVLLIFGAICFAQSTFKLDSLNNELKTAIENKEKKKEASLREEIQYEENKAKKLKDLTEDKKIAIFQEDYDRVILVEKQIENTKESKYGENKTSSSSLNDIASVVSNTNTNENKKVFEKKNKLSKPFSEYDYSDKIIGQFGMGFKTVDYTYNGYYTSETYSEFLMSYHFANSRWWVNKYLAGGMFYDIVFGDYFDLSVGPQMTAFADFDAVVLPYTSLGMGLGIDDDGETYLPIVYKLGSHIFFKQERNFGLFFELNLSLNHEYDYMPAYRFGLSWTRIKRKSR
ncbi:MAG: hypothetical protein OQJ96_12980 [Flavobacteriales bacterium]|nr:hypothetical protein [Flavobacteriales bacterium]MCW8913009.1 hypothetical protein [Flavobacteriales bacterium]MCW8938609.1 hypothetical protein [Flavobacteriales bacterium]MCW8969352.1 hypothetical protein [Flavobacteriales bacterium]MCW8989010.1 hypothetical protein [Flavobacteriales bacterium]